MGRIDHTLLFLTVAGLLVHTLMLGCDVGAADGPAPSVAAFSSEEEDCGCVEEAWAGAETQPVGRTTEADNGCPYVAMREAHQEVGVEEECPHLRSLGAEPTRERPPAEPQVDPSHTAERAPGGNTIWL